MENADGCAGRRGHTAGAAAVRPLRAVLLRTGGRRNVLYRALLGSQDPGRLLFLAVPDDVWNTLFQEPIGEPALEHALDRVVCFDPAEERIIRWTPPLSGET